MLVSIVVVLSSLLSSAFAGPHARLRSKNWAKKAGLIEVLSSGSSQSNNTTTFSPVTVAPKANIFISLTDDEAVGFSYHSSLNKKTQLSAFSTIKRS